MIPAKSLFGAPAAARPSAPSLRQPDNLPDLTGGDKACEPTNQEILADLLRVKVLFQQRAIAAHLGCPVDIPAQARRVDAPIVSVVD